MPKLQKFKDVHISPLTGPMNTATPLDLLPNKQFRYVKNFRVDGAGRLKRAGGFKALLDDGNYAFSCSNSSHATKAACETASATWSNKNNTDLHDQLGSKEDPSNTIRENITLLYEFESGGGPRKLIAATASRIYVLSQRSRNWAIIGDNSGAGYGGGIAEPYSTVKFKAAQLGNNLILTNNYNEPLFWFFDTHPDKTSKELVKTIPDLVKLKITKANLISEYKGFMFLGDLEEADAQQVAKVQWSDYVDATSYYPSLSSLAGQQTVGDIGEAIIGMAVLGDHLIIYKERSIWRCSLVSSANLFVFKQIYQGENTPYYTDTLINVGGAHFYMSERGIYRLTISDVSPVRVDWMRNASGLIFQEGETITAEDDSAAYCKTSAGTGCLYTTKATCESNGGSWVTTLAGGIKDSKITQTGTIAEMVACPSRLPVITAHPVNMSINANPCSASYTEDAVFSVQSSGMEPFTYQWQRKLTSASTWSDIAGANTNTHAIPRPQASDILDQEYRVAVTNGDGTVNSNAATVTLAGYSTNPSFTLHPTDSVKSAGSDHTFEVRFCTSVTSVQWRKAAAGTPANVTHDGTKYIVETGLVPPLSGTAGYYYSKLTIKNLEGGDSNTYDCQATNPSGTVDSNNGSVTVSSVASVTTHPETGVQTVTAGSTLTIITDPQDHYDVYPDETVGYHIEYVKGVAYKKYWSDIIGHIWRDGKIIPGHAPLIVEVIGGTPPYTFNWYRTADVSGVTINGAVARPTAVTTGGTGYTTGTATGLATTMPDPYCTMNDPSTSNPYTTEALCRAGDGTNVGSWMVATGVGATVDIVVSGGAITSAKINAAGTGYRVGDVITVVQTNGSGGTVTITESTVAVDAVSSNYEKGAVFTFTTPSAVLTLTENAGLGATTLKGIMSGGDLANDEVSAGGWVTSLEHSDLANSNDFSESKRRNKANTIWAASRLSFTVRNGLQKEDSLFKCVVTDSASTPVSVTTGTTTVNIKAPAKNKDKV
jgi:hypothetical protein